MSDEFESKTAGVGIVIFVVLCGLPALELTGFGFGLGLTLSTAVICAIIGGAVGGVLLCPKPWMAGLVGGLIAGPLGLLAVYYYSGIRNELYNVELVIAQGIGSLPGIGVGKLIQHLFAEPEDFRDDE